MEKYQELLIAVFRKILHYILVPYYWFETAVNPYITTYPKIPKHCLILSVVLITLGYMLAKLC